MFRSVLQFDFLDFGTSKSSFFNILRAWGTLFGGPGAHVEDHLDFYDFRDAFRRLFVILGSQPESTINSKNTF